MRNIRMMIVDDSEEMRSALKAAAGKVSGLRIQVVAEAPDGLAAVQTIGAIKPDIIVLDLNMPRMDGFEAAPKMQAKHKLAKILAVSALNDQASMMRIFDCGAHAFLSKPFLNRGQTFPITKEHPP